MKLAPTVALDTSAIVAGLLSWHQDHEVALQALEAVFARGRTVVLPLPALVEAYSVMTRLPAPHRLSPADALALLEDSPLGRCTPAGLRDRDGWAFLRALPSRGIAGGRTYDALVVACAKRVGASQVLTLNRRHFEGLDPDLEILDPRTS
jgi:predicted nucleic acid-binding protein